MQIARKEVMAQIIEGLRVNPICALLGPRQCGKTTIAMQFENIRRFDLEDPDDLQAFANPKLLLENLEGLVIIDEIQRAPEIFPYLRSLVDHNLRIKLLILGSASRELIKQSSESLAGRITYIEMTPFKSQEVNDTERLWQRGGFPKSYLADNDTLSFQWRKSYIRTFLEQDIPNLIGIKLNPQNLRRFWMMLCDYHANILNASELARSLDIDSKTVKNYLDILSGTFMVRQLQPWFVNISKRQVKSYKIYFRDSGLFHSLLGIENALSLSTSSKIGASWEGFAMEEIIRFNKAEPEDCFFWAAPSEAEIDLLIAKHSQKTAFEFKFSSTPKVTKSMHKAIEILGLEKITIIIPGKARYFLESKIEVCGLDSYLALPKKPEYQIRRL